MNSRGFPRRHGMAIPAILGVFASLFCCSDLSAQVNVLTNKVDNSRSGLNPNETLLSPSDVNTNQFGKLYTFNVDGYVSAQPLYMSNVTINGAAHNVVLIATEHDSVYAIDADTGVQLWQTSFLNSSTNTTTVPIATQGCSSVTKLTEIGILGTPVIDPTTGTLYVSAKTQTADGTTTYAHNLHALDITTGLEKFGGPALISGTVGSQTFVPLNHMQRPGLLLSNGTVYVAFGSNGCDLNARGWIFAYNAADLTQPPTIITTQQDGAYGSSVWQAGVGPAADSAGNVYVSTANGMFQYPTDLGDTIVKLSSGLGILDYFTPYEQSTLGSSDLDLGSGAVMLLPTQTGSTTPDLMVTSGKDQDIYLINRDNLGQYNTTINNIVQYMPTALLGEFFGSPLYWNNGSNQMVYFLAHQDYLRSYSLSTDANGNTSLSTTPTKTTVGKLTTFGLPEISANGTSNGIVWLVRNVTGVPLLSAYDANTLFLLYDSGMASGGRDSLGTVTHFATPTIANGKVFAGTQTQLVTYGLFPAITVTAGNNQTGNAGSTLPLPLTVTAINPYTGAPISGVTVTFSDGGKGGTFGTPVAITDSNGIASTTYKLPNTPQTLTITATSPGYAAATFTETDVVGPCATLTTVSGGKQTGTVGTTLPLAIFVKAKDSVGNVISGASISFSDNAIPTGSFSPNPAITGSNGQASTSYKLPTVAKTITVTATCGSATDRITEQSLPGPAVAINIIQGNNQTAHPNNKLPKTLIVQLVDQYGNGISGQTINFTDNGAGGTLTPSSPVTNSAGKVTVTYTTGPSTGTVTIDASYGTLPPAVFTETVD